MDWWCNGLLHPLGYHLFEVTMSYTVIIIFIFLFLLTENTEEVDENSENQTTNRDDLTPLHYGQVFNHTIATQIHVLPAQKELPLEATVKLLPHY